MIGLVWVAEAVNTTLYLNIYEVPAKSFLTRGFPRVITAHTYAQPAPPLAPRSGRKFSPRVLNSVPNNLELYSSTRWLTAQSTSNLPPFSRQPEPLRPQTFSPAQLSLHPTP